jgi:hypothetical protein
LPVRESGGPAGPVAQWLEPAAHNGLVPGSSPGRPTNEIRSLANRISGHRTRNASSRRDCSSSALAGQFEQLYSWINVNNFSQVFSPGLDTQDALLARGAAGDPSFTIRIPNGKPIRIPSLPQFIVTRGTAYYLLPRMKTLRRIAGLSE